MSPMARSTSSATISSPISNRSCFCRAIRWFVVTKNAVPAKSLGELLAWLKSRPNPGRGRYGGCGFGKPYRRALFRKRHRHQAAIRALSRHGAGAERSGRRPDRLDRRPDPRTRSTRSAPATIRAYAVTDDKRVESAPDIPTNRRSGLARISHDAVVGPVGAEGHASRDRG